MKFIKILFIIFISLTTTIKAESNQNLINELKNGGKIIFIRHALAPGGGDPENFDILNCNTQRNLNEVGREQAKQIGYFFNKEKIPIREVISSEWCRCKETASIAFSEYKTEKFLNSFFSEKFKKNKNLQIKNLRSYIDKWDKKKNLIFVTHYVVILEILDYAPSSGEIVISDMNFELIGSISNIK